MTAYDRVKVNTATTGTGSVVVGTAYQAQWQTFSGASVADAAVLILLIEDNYVSGVPTAWEIADSVYTLATTTATRVLRSSSTGSLLVLSGSATVAIIGVAAAEINQIALKNVANTFTATQTITPAVNTEGVTISGGSLTGSNASSFASITGTWNTSGAPTAIKANILNTASSGTSLLMDLQLSSTSYFKIRADGATTCGDNGTLVSGVGVRAPTTGVFYWNGSSVIYSPSNGVIRLTDTAETSFGRLQLGGTTSSYPSIKRSSATLAFRLADDSADASITANAYSGTGAALILSGTAIPAGGTAGSGYKFSSTSNFGVFFGSGAPGLSAAKGSLYLRSDGSGATDRAYINTDGGTTWTNLVTAG